MNFPDLETCRIIGAEFPESEFVYFSDEKGYATGSMIISRKEARRHIREIEGHCGEVLVFIDAPAPTCEELGVWLNKKDYPLGYYLIAGRIGEFELYKKSGERVNFCPLIKAENETQARAEAVKLILEERS
jgi:hypothetical protein